MEVCVVTGAAGGIGRAVVDNLIVAGWGVVAVDLDPSVHNLKNGRVATVAADVADRSTHARAVTTGLELGVLTGWVNNAAIQIPQLTTDLTEDHVRRQIDVNLLGAIWGCQAAATAMSNGGSIVNVSSIHALRGFPGALAYAATKGGISSMTRQLAVEYGARGIRCNAVLPGAISTSMCFADWASAPNPDAARAADEDLHLEGKMGTPQEVANVVAFLLAQQSSLINGQLVSVDGGATARPPYRSGGMREATT